MTPRQELLLSFLAAGPEPMDPIRIVKGMFIFGQEVPQEWLRGAELYAFGAHNWGPFSVEIYRDLDHLRHLGLAENLEQPGISWKYHRATEGGRRVAVEIRRRHDPRLLAFLAEVRAYTLRHTFNDLLRAVYKKYPDYAVNSVFRY